MKNKEVLQEDKPLSVRERITIHLLFLMLHIVKPSEYSHEWSQCEEDIRKEMEKKS